MKLGASGLTIALVLSSLSGIPSAVAQIVPDGTLPQNSIVLPPINNTSVIEGGTQVGGNLFHSFTDFSVPTGWEAFFNNPVTVENILTRITGTNASHIDGLIRANGTANLFLVNPNGIVFGPNAQLQIGGSFFGSTAESLVFADGSFYSATEPDAPPLLTINVPIGLQFGENPGQILVRSSTLEVEPDRTLSLVGGNVKLEDASLRAPEGRIEVGSVAAGSQVSFNPTSFAWESENVEQFGNLEISQQSVLDASGMGGGEIQLWGGRVFLTGESAILSKTLGSENGRGIAIHADRFLLEEGSLISTATEGSGRGGDVTLEASDEIDLSGRGNLLSIVLDLAESRFNLDDISDGIFAVSFGEGDAGNISIQTARLFLENGAIVATSTFDRGRGGALEVTATDAVNVNRSALITGTDGTGAAGNLTLSTQRLGVYDGGLLITTSIAEGRGGNLTVTASDWVELVSSPTFINVLVRGKPFGFGSSNLQSVSFSSGSAGNITIETRRLVIEDGSQIYTLAFASGRAGNILLVASESIELFGKNINIEDPINSFHSTVGTTTENSGSGGYITIETPRLIVRNGAQIQAVTWGSGTGGTIDVKASEFVELVGQNSGLFDSGLFVSSQLNASGNSGNIKRQTGTLIVRDGAVITATLLEPTNESGEAGDIDIVTDNLYLDNGIIRSDTGRGDFGNIRVRSSGMQLRHGSLISTNSGSKGGNIDIDTDTLTALENSDISANSQQSEGGQITINTQGVLGTEFRDFPTPQSDLTATSALGPEFNGVVEINLEGVDPTSGLVKLPENVVDVEDLLDTRCSPGNSRRSEFVATGRGGIPRSPTDMLSSSSGWVDPEGKVSDVPIDNPTPPLVEAQGWIINEKGQVELVAQMPNRRLNLPLDRSSLGSLNCGVNGDRSNE
ncbi:MAG TPA: S-layer family protein [Oscillatoriales cyanobacterium M59_W2019_021]|nr:MAG: S-layer family protein [Cyanobacteria bacterium J055]HIK31450.1 S-layer family protein [Oscillatoriales cyanobacterium M4454_W2019_049]HIK53292.1 S-layer family protein [Oscillatoriales cyanobacterium M59_W2019_021]